MSIGFFFDVFTLLRRLRFWRRKMGVTENRGQATFSDRSAIAQSVPTEFYFGSPTASGLV